MKARPLTISGSKPNKLTLLSLLAAVLCILPQIGMSQNLVTEDTAEWFTLGGDYAHTRYSPADEITAENFDELEVAWEWDGSSFNGQSGRSTPTYVDGKLFTVSGARRISPTYRSQDWRDPVVLSPTKHRSLGIFHARLIRKRHRLFQNRWKGRGLYLHTWLLSSSTRC